MLAGKAVLTCIEEVEQNCKILMLHPLQCDFQQVGFLKAGREKSVEKGRSGGQNDTMSSAKSSKKHTASILFSILKALALDF